MTAYFAPIRDMQFVINELADLSRLPLPTFAEQEVGPSCWKPSRRKPPNWPPRCWRRSTNRATLGVRIDPCWSRSRRRLHRGVSKLHRRRLERHRQPCGTRWPRSAGAVQHGDPGDVEFGQHVLRAVPDAQRRRDRAISRAGRRATGAVPAEHGQRRMDRHHESDQPQAGSDLSAVRTRAVPQDDHYRIFGRRSSSPGAITT